MRSHPDYERILLSLLHAGSIRFYRFHNERNVVNRLVGDKLCKRGTFFFWKPNEDDDSVKQPWGLPIGFLEGQVYEIWLTKKGYKVARELQFINDI